MAKTIAHFEKGMVQPASSFEMQSCSEICSKIREETTEKTDLEILIIPVTLFNWGQQFELSDFFEIQLHYCATW